MGEKVDAIATTYIRIRRVGSSPRQFNSVIEHIDFLKVMMGSLDLERGIQNIDKLINKLRDGAE